MLKIGFAVYSPSQINSFFKSGVLRELALKANVELFISSDTLAQRASLYSAAPIRFFKPPKYCRKLVSYVQMATLWKNRDRSMNHLVRAMASFGSRRQRAKWKCVVVSEMNTMVLKRLLVKLVSIKFIYFLIGRLEHLTLWWAHQTNLKSTFGDLDALLVPFSGHIGADFGILVNSAKRSGIPVFAIQENWDNLATKTFITEEPDFFFVWGEQSAGHLRSVHRLFTVEAITVGSPRFAPYYSENDAHPSVSELDNETISLENQEFVLVSGTGDGMDDAMLVGAVCDAIKEKSEINTRLKIVYRPHPMTRTRVDFGLLKSQEPSLLVDGGINAGNFGHHNLLVQRARLVVNHFSTIALEALVVGTPVMVPLFLGRPEAKYRYPHILNEWHHMLGVSLLPGISLPQTAEEMKKNIQKILSHPRNVSNNNIEWLCKRTNYTKHLFEQLSSRVDPSGI
jgi:hypothetical protein